MSPRGTTAGSLILTIATMLVLVGCGGSAGSQATSGPVARAGTSAAGDVPSPTHDPGAATATPHEGSGGVASPGGAGSSDGAGPIGGDIGDRSKGSVQAQITGGLTASIDLPFGALAAQLLGQGPGTAYLPFTDAAKGTLFLTIADNQLLVQYAGPNDVGLTNGATACELKLDALDNSQAKGTFTCKGMMLIQGGTIGSADMTGAFEAHR